MENPLGYFSNCPSNFVALCFALLESVADPEGEFAKLLEDRDSTWTLKKTQNIKNTVKKSLINVKILNIKNKHMLAFLWIWSAW